MMLSSDLGAVTPSIAATSASPVPVKPVTQSELLEAILHALDVPAVPEPAARPDVARGHGPAARCASCSPRTTP